MHSRRKFSGPSRVAAVAAITSALVATAGLGAGPLSAVLVVSEARTPPDAKAVSDPETLEGIAESEAAVVRWVVVVSACPAVTLSGVNACRLATLSAVRPPTVSRD